MSVSWLTALVVATTPAEFGFDRVDVLAEQPGTFIHDDLVLLDLDPVTVAVRFVEQVQVVCTVPVPGLTVGVSLAAQSLYYSVSLPGLKGLEMQLGLQTKLFLPVGFSAQVAWRIWRLRVGVGGVAATTASWDRIDYDRWFVLPTLSVGILFDAED